MNWRFQTITSFGDIKNDWDRVNSAETYTPLLDSDFVEPLLKTFGSGNEVIATGRENGQICCIAVLHKTGIGRWQTFQPSQAPIGLWNQRSSMPMKDLAISLLNALPAPVFQLGITQQDPDFVARADNLPRLRTLDYIQTARVTVAGTFDDYWADRGKNLKQNMKRQRNRLARENMFLNLKVIRESGDISDAVQAYGELESRGWKSQQGTAIHIDNDQGLFYSTMLRLFAEKGRALIFQYYYGNELVATDFCILGGGTLIILKTTYNESISGSSPAMLMREEAFNLIFSTKLAKKIEFYGKVMEWHTRWADEFRTMYHLNAESSMGSFARKARHFFKSGAR